MKTRKRLIPVDVFDIPKMQSYLSDMAAEGLFLRKIGSYAHFEEGQPMRLTHRLDHLMREEMQPREEQIEHYKKYGCDYVCTIQNGFHIYSSEKSEFVELHRDPVIQSYAFTKLAPQLGKSRCTSAHWGDDPLSHLLSGPSDALCRPIWKHHLTDADADFHCLYLLSVPRKQTAVITKDNLKENYKTAVNLI